jgi:hypothetical protein
MAAILRGLQSAGALACEAAQREAMGALCGLAGVLWLAGDAAGAAAAYRRVIGTGGAADARGAAARGTRFDAAVGAVVTRVDAVQRIHAIRNLLELVGGAAGGGAVGGGAAGGGAAGGGDDADAAGAQPLGALHFAALARSASQLEDAFLGAAAGAVAAAVDAAAKEQARALRALRDAGVHGLADAATQSEEVACVRVVSRPRAGRRRFGSRWP